MSEKGIFFLILLLPLWVSLEGQSSYQEAISMGDQALKQQQFEKAINYYFAAEAFDPAKGNLVKLKVSKAFKAIQALKIKADNKTKALQKNQAELGKTLEEVDQARTEAQSNLDKANKLIDAFYFYEGRFALAYKGSRFYYIDKEGNEVTKLGKWRKAGQFDSYGFAKVEGRGVKYLLDTLGRTFEVAYSINELNDRVRALDLRGVKIESFPDDLFEFTQLEIILASSKSRSINSLPPTIAKLKNLIHLDLGLTRIVFLPEEIGQLNNLTYLDLNNTLLMKLPKGIGRLSKLKYLNLANTRIRDLPEEIGDLSSLTDLNLRSTNLSNLPKEIGQLKNLTNLNLLGSIIKSLPPEIGLLNELCTLNLAVTRLDSLPPEIGQLTNLSYLDVSSTNLQALPEGVYELEKLIHLGLGETYIASLSPEIKRLSNLQSFMLHETQLKELPPEFDQLVSLRKLTLFDTYLKELPKVISKLENLNLLVWYSGSLDWLSISKVLSKIDQDVKLTNDGEIVESYHSNLFDTGDLLTVVIPFNEVPEEIFEIENVTELELINISNDNLSPQIGQLKKLRSLKLYSSTISKLPIEISKCLNLVEIDLQDLNIESLPHTIGKLKNLSIINLRGSSIKSIPEEITQLHNLEVFDLRNTPISTVDCILLAGLLPTTQILCSEK